MPFTKGKMILLVTRSLSTGIHVAHSIYPKKKPDFYISINVSFRDAFTIQSPAFGWRDGGRLWKISGLLETGFRIMFGVSQVYEQAGGLGTLQGTNLLHLYVHIQSTPAFLNKNFYFLFLRKVKERDINETTNKSGIGDSISLS